MVSQGEILPTSVLTKQEISLRRLFFTFDRNSFKRKAIFF